MKKIAILGSAKDHNAISKIATELEKNGFYVFLFPNARELRQTPLSETVLHLVDKGLIYSSFEKIKKSDYILFANINGYMGNSATLELGYATALSKHIFALNHDKELTRDALFTDVLETENSDEIIRKLSCFTS